MKKNNQKNGISNNCTIIIIWFLFLLFMAFLVVSGKI
jgi:hypothetical protein